MLQKTLRFSAGLAFFCFFSLTAVGQQKFEGALRNTEDYTNQTPASTATVTVYLSGGIQAGSTKAPKLQDCAGRLDDGKPFEATGGSFCFKGKEKTYDVDVIIPLDSIKVRRVSRVISEENIATAGNYKLTDFGALGDASSDNTYLIKSAMAYIGTRPEPGGLLIIPNGIFKVFAGTAKLPIVMPPGLTFQGTNGKGNFGSSRIQMEANDQTLFRLGNNTNNVTGVALILRPQCTVRLGNSTTFSGISTVRW